MVLLCPTISSCFRVALVVGVGKNLVFFCEKENQVLSVVGVWYTVLDMLFLFLRGG